MSSAQVVGAIHPTIAIVGIVEAVRTLAGDDAGAEGPLP